MLFGVCLLMVDDDGANLAAHLVIDVVAPQSETCQVFVMQQIVSVRKWDAGLGQPQPGDHFRICFYVIHLCYIFYILALIQLPLLSVNTLSPLTTSAYGPRSETTTSSLAP